MAHRHLAVLAVLACLLACTRAEGHSSRHLQQQTFQVDLPALDLGILERLFSSVAPVYNGTVRNETCERLVFAGQAVCDVLDKVSSLDLLKNTIRQLITAGLLASGTNVPVDKVNVTQVLCDNGQLKVDVCFLADNTITDQQLNDWSAALQQKAGSLFDTTVLKTLLGYTGLNITGDLSQINYTFPATWDQITQQALKLYNGVVAQNVDWQWTLPNISCADVAQTQEQLQQFKQDLQAALGEYLNINADQINITKIDCDTITNQTKVTFRALLSSANLPSLPDIINKVKTVDPSSIPTTFTSKYNINPAGITTYFPGLAPPGAPAPPIGGGSSPAPPAPSAGMATTASLLLATCAAATAFMAALAL